MDAPARALIIGALAALIVVLVLADRRARLLPAWKAVVLGAVEGTTEFLPVSSTGHLLVAGRLLGLGDGADESALGTYIVAIQLGAIVAVLGLYRQRVHQLARGVLGLDDAGRRSFNAIVVAAVPAAAVGSLLGPFVKNRLFAPWPVVAAWAAGGLLLLIFRPPRGGTTPGLDAISKRQALIIGVAQIAALWPGTSRSLVTLVAGLAVGLSLTASIEFTFLVGVAILTAASAWDLARNGEELVRQYGWSTPLLGAAAAFLAATVTVRWMTRYLRRDTLRGFGWYRLAVAAAVAMLLLSGAI